MDCQKNKLVVGLGNPGKEYCFTRHNLGARVVEALGLKHGVFFFKEKKLLGNLGRWCFHDVEVVLFMPSVFMNVNGKSVKRCVDFFGFSLEDVLVIADDITKPFGTINFMPHGGNRGHNGFKSVSECLASANYARIFMGVGDRLYGTLENHVLSKFTNEEESKMKDFVDSSICKIEEWLF